MLQDMKLDLERWGPEREVGSSEEMGGMTD